MPDVSVGALRNQFALRRNKADVPAKTEAPPSRNRQPAYGVEMIAPIAESGECLRKMGVHCVAIADAGEWNDFSLGDITFVGS